MHISASCIFRSLLELQYELQNDNYYEDEIVRLQ